MGFRYSEKIEKVQSKVCKRYCSLSTNTLDCFAPGECGRLPLAVTYLPNYVKYWIILLHMQAHRYPKQCYIMLKRLDDMGRVTWASKIMSLLFKFGFGFAWVAQDVGNLDYFLMLLTERIRDCYRQNWHANVNKLSKVHHYKLFKSLLAVMKYLSLDLLISSEML